MADNWTSLIDIELLDDFDVPPYDPTVARRELASIVDRARVQIAENKIKARNKLWRVGAKGDIAFELVYRGMQIDIELPNGDTHYQLAFKRENANQVLNGLAEFIRSSGVYDAQLANAQAVEMTDRSKGNTTSRAVSTGTRTRWSDDPEEFLRQFTEKFGPAPSADHVPNSTRTKWVDKKFAERGKKARAARSS